MEEAEDNRLHSESDQLQMWDCTSIIDIKNACKLNFIIDERHTFNVEHNNKLNATRVRCNENSCRSGDILKKLHSELQKSKPNTYCLEYSDAIFDFIPAEVLKNEYNKMPNKCDVTILLYRQPRKILELEKQQ